MPENYLVDPTVVNTQSAPQRQYPPELGNNSIVQQAYAGQQQAMQGIQGIAKQQQDADATAAYQNLFDTVALVKKAAPSNDEFETHQKNVAAAQAKVDALELKGRALLNERHPLRNTIIQMASALSPLAGGAASLLSGASKENKDAMQIAQDIMSGRAQLKTSSAQQAQDLAHLKESMAAQDMLIKAKQARSTSGAQVFNEMAVIASHYLGIAKAPGEMEHTAQQIKTSKSTELLNNYYRENGLPAAKVESEKLGNRLKQKELTLKDKELAKPAPPAPLDEGTKADIDYQKFIAKHETTTAETAAKSFHTQAEALKSRLQFEKRPEVVKTINSQIIDFEKKANDAILEGKTKSDAALQKVHELSARKSQSRMPNPPPEGSGVGFPGTYKPEANADAGKPEVESSPSGQLESFAQVARNKSLPMADRIEAAKRYKELKQIADKGK